MTGFPELSLSVVMPAYNEEATIEATIRRAVSSLRRQVGLFELILVEDCSTDRTPEVAEALARELPEVRVLHNPMNLRQGGSLRRGFAEARLDLVTHNGMDYPFDFDDLPLLLQHFPAADLVIAARRSYPGVSAQRRLVSWVNRTLISALFGTRFIDYNFIQVYRRPMMQSLGGLSTATPFITPELIIRADQGGYRVVEVRVDYHPRLAGKASSANWRNIHLALRDMGRLFVELRVCPGLRAGRARSKARP